MGEIRKRHDAMAADAQHLPKYFQRLAGFLQRLAEDDVVEDIVRVIGKSLLDIALKNGDAARNSALDQRSRDLDTARIDAFVRGKPCEQLAVAATEIEHFCSRLNNVADDGVVAAPEKLTDKGLGVHGSIGGHL